ncbi:MAG: hypothetical protein VX583_05090 [Bdellovibrionota bacterium]|nr:hypothetical protein [Pseudobdellovibrionaceae bacterium]
MLIRSFCILIQSISLFSLALMANEGLQEDRVDFYRYNNPEIGFTLDQESALDLHLKMPEYLNWQEVLSKIDPEKLGREPGSGKVFSITSGIPFILPMSCTSFPLIHPFTKQLMMATATHCVFGSEPEKYSDYATSGNSIMGVQNYLAKGINISGAYHKEYSYITDTILTAIPEEKAEDFGKDNAFEMADRLPQRGDIVYMEGYKGYNIPLVGGLTWGTRVSCVYMGKFYDIHSKPVFNKAGSVIMRYDINDYLYCPEGLGGGGMSGGPITNSEGKVIGINTRRLTGLDSAINVDYDVFAFSSLTKADYEFEDREKLLPIRDGLYKYRNVNNIYQSSLPYKGKMCISGSTIKDLSVNFKNGYMDGPMRSRFEGQFLSSTTYFDMGIPYRFAVSGSPKTEADFINDEDKRSPCDPNFDIKVDRSNWYGGLFSAFAKDYGPKVKDRFAKMDKEVWVVYDETNEMHREKYENAWQEMIDKYKDKPAPRRLGPRNRVLKNYLKMNDD